MGEDASVENTPGKWSLFLVILAIILLGALAALLASMLLT